MSVGAQVPQNFPPIAPDDLVRLGVESQFIPFVVSMVSRAEQAPNSLPPFSLAEVESLVEILDKVVSSTTADPNLKNRCFRVLRRVSPAHGVLPKSYFLPGVTLIDNIPYAAGGFADIWKGQQDGKQVCVKAFRTQTPTNLDKIRRRFYREIVGWKHVSHPNVLPFLGVSESLFSFCFISPWMPGGNILEYIRKHQGVNRLQLLAQAACGLEYLHSLNIVHSDVNPGNILVTEWGDACIGDFGITGVITDPGVVEPGTTTTSKPGVVRYMAPELLNPLQFNLANSNPSKEGDVYSFAMTTYETLAEVLPYGNLRDGIIIFHIVNGERPPRPTNARWLQDRVWNMIMACWSERREQRWDIRTVYNLLSASSLQEVPDAEPDVETTQTLNAFAVAPPKDPPPVPLFIKLEGNYAQPNPSIQQEVGTKSSVPRENLRSRTAPAPNTPRGTIPKKRFAFLSLLHSGRDTSGPGTDLSIQGEGTRKLTILSRGWSHLQTVVKVSTAFLRLRRIPRGDGRPSR